MFLHARHNHSNIPLANRKVFGYRWPGLLVPWRAHALTTGSKEMLSQAQFPTDDPTIFTPIFKRNIWLFRNVYHACSREVSVRVAL
jgi:hypothetical protein